MTTKTQTAIRASSDEQSSRAVDLHFEIETKLSQAKGICALICETPGNNDAVSEAASAAEDLIEGVEKALDELRGMEHPKEVQS